MLSNSLWTLSSNGSRVCLPTSARDSSFSVETETEPRLIQVSSCHIPWGLQSKLAFVKNVYHDCKAAVFRESFQESLEITSWISITDSYLIVREEQLSIDRRFASITDNTMKWQWQDSGSESNKDAGKSSGSKSHSALSQVSIYQLFQICSWNINRGASWCNPDVCASGKYSRAVGLTLALDSALWVLCLQLIFCNFQLSSCGKIMLSDLGYRRDLVTEAYPSFRTRVSFCYKQYPVCKEFCPFF